ncbi:UDP-N-acetylenolpyruvoylglucosamine reductase [Candidatus Uhrbacteria bacterium RIFCSPLOWO2_12_FULL_46_10]|uniref:UDP-N-acetylenolpyruvoylglucosamine reductase n=1 Tax=Candidatus Uhrbacteria bacterium RIFCSPLOWO2_01_FULL_47_25 TaxID=1802402 RepID=A0A1F7UPL6_9BACT|nr:MAG: UDP-N-acetylenolpyruvoylglucosamine reductase [Parcubacteria group bacterium GW2011_GWA2_46_9]OGL59210.1 MAG: UDP-N-acetylenolpyruvoylglucosamine reductase [Candidatus Uhrbacteria bacterium RIFCSPHIGHO2_01_FULL_46_23]OGL69158.1 MAG: UDP-N-acetylenolpyruvoylglucosamine reductase [Candidatus Uhrbacteria bacterium RIFCSPHIGHO2_02_FULL_47_29]OGL75561.1 MAG: UDP-N-acetylenolpyruvoylglucosamine reductase [Candidatus Uhrbacteria bacterium RIFCSPHIGHO2_12_FULL_46_13]OGL80221.1 MAG: UDP-N-acetyl
MTDAVNFFSGTKFVSLVKKNEPLAPHTTLGIGGPVDYYIETDKDDEAAEILRYAHQCKLPVFVLGAGSNIVVADSGWRGLVLRYTNRQLIFHNSDDTIVEASAGLNWDDLVVATVARGLAGIECLSGVPGLVGAAPVQNIGCYGQEAAATIETVETIDCQTGTRRQFSRQECGFGYRQSRFKKTGGYLITKVIFRLSRINDGAVLYDDVARELSAQHIVKPTLGDVRQTVLAIRRRKSMVIDKDDPNSRGVGSFFVNPIVTRDTSDELQRASARLFPSKVMPRWPMGGELVKLSAAWLIESAGFQRGDVFGRVGISANHTLAIINRGGAKASDVVALAGQIRQRVRDVFGVVLEPEPVFVGFNKTVGELLKESS